MSGLSFLDIKIRVDPTLPPGVVALFMPGRAYPIEIDLEKRVVKYKYAQQPRLVLLRIATSESENSMNEPELLPDGKAFRDLLDGEYWLPQPLEGITRTLDGQRPVDAKIIVVRGGKPAGFRENIGTPLIVAPSTDDEIALPVWPGLQVSMHHASPTIPASVEFSPIEEGEDE